MYTVYLADMCTLELPLSHTAARPLTPRPPIFFSETEKSECCVLLLGAMLFLIV